MAENSTNLWKDLNIKVHVADNFPPNLKPKRSSLRHIIIKMYWVVMPSSRGIFPTQGSNPGLLHCRQILYQLSHQGSPKSKTNNFKSSEKKKLNSYKGTSTRLSVDFSVEILEARREWDDIFKVPKD